MNPKISAVFVAIFLNHMIEEKVYADNDLTSILRRNVYYNRDDVPTQNKGEKHSIIFTLYILGKPTQVIIQMYIEGMSSFRAQSMVCNIYYLLKCGNLRISTLIAISSLNGWMNVSHITEQIEFLLKTRISTI